MLVETGNTPMHTQAAFLARYKGGTCKQSAVQAKQHTESQLPTRMASQSAACSTLMAWARCALLPSQNPCCMQAAVIHHEGSDKARLHLW